MAAFSATLPLTTFVSAATSIAAIATPVAPAALGMLRLSGPLSAKVFPDLIDRPRQAVVKKYRTLEGQLIDQIVAVFYPAQSSFTGEATLELTAHGNPFILGKILADLLARGFVLAQPGEFTRRAFLNGRIDLTQAEAIAELIAAQSDRALTSAHRQLAGELGARLKDFSQELISLIAAVEATIDFPEEDVPAHLPPAQKFEALLTQLSALQRTHRAHTLTFRGARVALVGAPNAGKSSLFNALLNHARALVSPIAGTTRDYLEATLTLEGHLVTLIDTAGLNTAAEKQSLESLGIEKTREQLATADVVVFVYDGTLPAPALPAGLDPQTTLIVANKSDLSGFRGGAHIHASATTPTGVQALRQALIQRLTQLMPGADTLMVSARHAAALEHVLAQISSALELLQKKSEPSLIAHHLHSALHHLGEILGRFDNEQILDSLFNQFCIGK